MHLILLKEFKGIRKESLRDNMSDIEVVLTDLGEITTRKLAKVAKDKLEEKLGKSVIDYKNKLDYSYEK